MSKFRNLVIATALTAPLAVPAFAEPFGLGRAALPEEIAAWNLDVSPDGTGLPPGSGSVADGEELFSDRCAVCHGEFAEGVDNWPKLAGGMDTLNRKDPLKTVGSYWPYLSTVWDYAHRSMPFGNAQTLSADETYAIVAYIIYSNDLVDDDFVLSNENFLEVEMPNADGFIVDDRETVEYPEFSKPACMENCKESVEITAHATVLDVTPNDPNDDAPAAEAPATDAPAEEAAAPAAEAATEVAAAAPAEVDPALVAAGETVFKKCKACHKIGEGAKHATGPSLNGVVGRKAGGADGFKYSPAMIAAGEGGMVWDHETIGAYLKDPKGFVPKNKMSFAGLKKDDDVAAVLAYIEATGQ
ncbi:c-type cytochrome [Sinirhodobacter sp. WL0062]|uniref:C-type cytochrome n=1 Tax=Rhodobacter flavimaris TaxID=2907145 RepID=A0ABS8YPX7_9RHOB|nr:c-type cytochrome [Sinirhodobacter sp. WL0062]MCE5971956.1 c-type cytochrome [Sinirhodobacter sp. WL0062]